MRSRLRVLLVGGAVAALMLAMAGVAWADHHHMPPGPPLRITDVIPNGGSTVVSPNATITIFFDKDMNSNTLVKNVKLKRVGVRRAVNFAIESYSGSEKKYEARPNDPLKPNTPYKVVVDGGLDGVRSLDGGKLGGVDDSSATFKDGNVVWTFRTAP